MRVHLLSLAAAILATTILLGMHHAHAAAPHWIGGPDEGPQWRFTKTIAIDEPLQSATIKLAADFCQAEASIDGRSVLTLEPYCQTQEVEITHQLRRGKNEIVLVATRVPGPAAVAFSLTLTSNGGKSTQFVSDESWQGAVSLGTVPPELWGLGRRSAAISPFDNYEQWQQAKNGASDKSMADKLPKFWLAPGFEVTRVRQAAANEGSWIALAFDDAGRATISREDTGLLRMTLANDRRSVARVEQVKVDLPECRGLLYVGDRLYANANNAKTQYRLRINERGEAQELEKVREFPGGVGHGRNDLALGPDDAIYTIHGDSVQAPGMPVLDRTSPLRDSRRGPAKQEGFVARADRSGKQWELFCTGLRNPYGIAANTHGDLFTYDADNEYDMGMPWYRPTRIVQLVSGADYGWRVAQGTWPPYFPDRPDNCLPTIDVGRGSPTAVMFGTKLAFPPAYREALYTLDWAYGRVLAVHLAPRGAGYRAALELFMQGKPLNVTDIAAGPDGAMWLITGGRKTQSSLYRVAYTGKAEPAATAGWHEQDCQRFSAEARKLRGKLEAYHGRADGDALSSAGPHLASHDPLLRHAARIAIEQAPRQKLRGQIESLLQADPSAEQHVERSLECLLMLARTGDPALVPAILDQFLRLPAEKTSLSARFLTAHLVSECRAVGLTETNKRSDELAKRMALDWPNLATDGLRVSPYGTNIVLRRRLAPLLASLGSPGVIERVQSSLGASSVQEDRLQGLFALRSLRSGWTTETRKAYFATLNDAAKAVGGEGLPSFLERLRNDAIASLSDAERLQYATLFAPKPIEDEPIPQRPKVRAWSLKDLGSLADEDAPRGSHERGAKIFREALCSRCHRAGLSGPAVGPDLTFVARRFSRRDMLEAIVMPSKSVAENYRNVQILTQDGRVHIGRLLNEGDFRRERLKLNTDPLRAGQIVEIDKKDIAEERLHDTSPMPQGLLDTFTLAEIADLLAFLEEGR